MSQIDHLSLAKSVFQDAAELRHALHQDPELSCLEYRTRALIARHLDSLGIPYELYSNGGICALIGRGSPAVALRADMDALPIDEDTDLPFASRNPGIMHACGHDIHTAVLLGSARIFKSMENRLPGTVKLFFQPAEETVGGAKTMIDEGCMSFPDVKAVLGLHVDPTIPLGAASFLPGEMNAAVIDLHMAVHGRACHGAHPDQGTDAIVAAAHIITALQTIDSRITAPTTPVVVTIGSIEGGHSGNIIAGEVVMRGTVRVLDTATGEMVKGHLRRIASSVASAWGCTVDIDLSDNCPALINDSKLTRLIIKEAASILGPENVIRFDTPSMGADDFAYFTAAAPGCYFNIGTARPGDPPQVLHSGQFAPPDECILTGLALMSAGAWRILEAPL